MSICEEGSWPPPPDRGLWVSLGSSQMGMWLSDLLQMASCAYRLDRWCGAPGVSDGPMPSMRLFHWS